MTTFFLTGAGPRVVDCWSTRLASFRTSEVLIIRRVDRVLPARVDPSTTTASPDTMTLEPSAVIEADPATLVNLRSAS